MASVISAVEGATGPAASRAFSTFHVESGPNPLPYAAYTLNLLNGSLLPQNALAPGCSLPVPAPYIVHFPAGPTAALALPSLHELFVACPTGIVLVVNDTTGALLATVPVGALPIAFAARDVGGSDLVYVANWDSSNVTVISSATNRVVGSIDSLPALSSPSGLAFGPGAVDLYVTEYSVGVVGVLSAATGALVASIPVGEHPSDVAFDPLNGLLYVTNEGSNSVSVLSPRNHSVVETVAVGSAPSGVAAALSNGELFVSNRASANVSLISGTSNRVVANVPVGPGPLGIAYSSTSGLAYVAVNASDSVALLDPTTDAVVAHLAVGTEPVGFAVAPDAVLSVNTASYNLSRISTAAPRVLGTIEIAASPRGMAFDPVTSQLFVPLGGNDSVAAINTTTQRIVALIRTGLEPSFAVYDPDNGRVYVDNHMSDTISVIDPLSDTVLDTIPVGEGPTSMVIDPASGDLYVGGGHIYLVEIVNTTTDSVTGSIPVGNTPYGLVYANVDGGRIYVTNYRSANLSVIDPSTNTVVGNYPLAAGPTLMAYQASQQTLYISSFGKDQLLPFNTTTDTLGAPIPVGATPLGVLTGGPAGMIYVANYGSDNLTVVSPSGQRVVGSVSVGSEPIAAALLPNGYTYVTDAGSSAITLLSNNSLLSVAISASQTTLPTTSSVQLTAQTACTLGPCPWSVHFRWSSTSLYGKLNASTGSVVTFASGNQTETVQVTVTATLGTANASATASLTVGGPPTFLGFTGSAGYIVLASGIIAAAAVIGSGAWVWRSRRSSRGRGG